MDKPFLMPVEDIFTIQGRGTVATGRIERGQVKINETVEGYPGLYRDVQTYLKERIKEVLTGAGASIVVRLYGPDLEVLRSKAKDVNTSRESVDSVVVTTSFFY